MLSFVCSIGILCSCSNGSILQAELPADLDLSAPKMHEMLASKEILWIIRQDGVEAKRGSASAEYHFRNREESGDAMLSRDGHGIMVLTSLRVVYLEYEDGLIKETKEVLLQGLPGHFSRIIGEKNGLWLYKGGDLFCFENDQTVTRVPASHFCEVSPVTSKDASFRYPAPAVFFSDIVGNSIYFAFACAPHAIKYAILEPGKKKWVTSVNVFDSLCPLLFLKGKLVRLERSGFNDVAFSEVPGLVSSTGIDTSVRNLFLRTESDRLVSQAQEEKGCALFDMLVSDKGDTRPWVKTTQSTLPVSFMVDEYRIHYWTASMSCDNVNHITLPP
jgi:hypothetical protein